MRWTPGNRGNVEDARAVGAAAEPAFRLASVDSASVDSSSC